jgi:hypothetical protein
MFAYGNGRHVYDTDGKNYEVIDKFSIAGLEIT